MMMSFFSALMDTRITEKITETSAKVAESANGTSFLNLFFKADFVIQLVMVGLVIASVWSWTIIIDKIRRLKKLRKTADEFEEMFWNSSSLDLLYDNLIHHKKNDPIVSLFCSGIVEWRHYISRGKKLNFVAGSVEQRIDRVMQLIMNKEIMNLEKHMGFLASLGSNGMIVGLFGTVLGIMHSFQSIAMLNNTSLSVVAPGIAEALFATAIGLVAAIPAAIAYNKISSDIVKYANRLEMFASEFGTIVSREIED